MDNTVELSAGSVELNEKDSLYNMKATHASLNKNEKQKTPIETNSDYSGEKVKVEDNTNDLINIFYNEKSRVQHISTELKSSFPEIKIEKSSNESINGYPNKKVKADNTSNRVINTPPQDGIKSNDQSNKLIDRQLDDDIKKEEIEIKNVSNEEESNAKGEGTPSLEELMVSDTFPVEAKDFIKVFVKGKYAKNNSLPCLEIYEDLVKIFLTDESHYETVMRNMPTSVIIYYSLKRKRKNEKSKLKPPPKSKNNVNAETEWVLQEVACQGLPKDIVRCSHCVTKQKDQCRYRGVRIVAQDKGGNVIKAPFCWQEYSDLENERIMLPGRNKRVMRGSRFDAKISAILEIYTKIDKQLPLIDLKSKPDIDASLRNQHLDYILKQCSISLKGLMDLQLDLFNFSTLHFKSTHITGQHQCDNCSITLLNIYFLNTHCGIELCFNCYLMNNKINIGGKCFQSYEHPITEFIPVTIFPKYIIQWLKDSCEELVKEEVSIAPTVNEKLFVYNGADINEEGYDRLYKPYLRGTEEEIGLQGYQYLMQKGIPFVVKDIRLDQLEYFGAESLNKYYGDVEIEKLVDSSKIGTKVLLKEFLSDFNGFKDSGEKTAYKKIKDWPSFSDFKTVFPKIYNAFLNALPFKHCTQPDGTLNLASYLPQILNPPDLGPKMYIATGRENTQYGTTPLHLDAADAVNIMTHSYKSGHEIDNTECAALWHLFDYKDIPKIRQYLSKWAKTNKKGKDFNDYIHDQKIYVTEVMLDELYEKYNIKAYQIYQNPGDAVFIPAGCAHQVLNLSNCIKLATDFISPERTIQCMHIAKEFSKLPKIHPRNGDIVQTENHVLYACSHAISKLTKAQDKLLNYTILQTKSERIDNKVEPDIMKETKKQSEKQAIVQNPKASRKRLRPERSPERKLPRRVGKGDPDYK